MEERQARSHGVFFPWLSEKAAQREALAAFRCSHTFAPSLESSSRMFLSRGVPVGCSVDREPIPFYHLRESWVWDHACSSAPELHLPTPPSPPPRPPLPSTCPPPAYGMAAVPAVLPLLRTRKMALLRNDKFKGLIMVSS